MVRVFHLTLRRVIGYAYIMMGADDETSTFSRKKFSNCLDFVSACLLFRNHMIEAEDHHRIGIAEDLFVEW
jgi:hypothetical protein